MTVSLFRTRTLSDTVALDRRLYTSPHSLRITPRIPGPGKPDLNRFHGCKLLSAGRLSISHCTRPHPCTVTAAHHPHTRPPDIQARLAYQRSLLNTYSTSDLGRLRAPQRNRPRLALALTRSGAGVDLLGIRPICLMMTPAPLHVAATVAPAPLLPVAVLALAPTALKPAVKTGTLLEPGSLGIFLPQPCSSTAGSSGQVPRGCSSSHLGPLSGPWHSILLDFNPR